MLTVLMFSLVAAGASAETVVFRDSTGQTELVDTQNPGAHAMPVGPWEMHAKAGGIAFNVSYADVTSHNGIGFDDATNGAARRARVGEIFDYLNTVLNHTGVCDVAFEVSDNAGGGGPGVLASAGSYYWQDAGFTNGFAFDHISTGTDPTGSVADIHAVVHFGWPWYQGTGTPSGSEIDLKSVLLHEISHGLGLLSLTNSNGSSDVSGTYAKWDDLLETGNSKKLFGNAPPAFLGVASDLLGGDGGVRFTGASAVAIFGSKPPIFSPNPWQSGSSIAHWPTGTAGNPVMEWAFNNGEVVRAYAPFEIGALNDIGYTVVAAPEGEGEVVVEGEGEPPAPDSDGDGYNDSVDAFPHNPNEWADADADGLGDNFEQAIVDADPGDTIDIILDVLPGDDFDGDGSPNAQEFVFGTDPTDPNDPGQLPLFNWTSGRLLALALTLVAAVRLRFSGQSR